MRFFINQKKAEIVRLPIFPGELLLLENFISEQFALTIMQRLKDQIQWKQDTITMFGKVHPVPRLTAWYGDAGKTYTYSGIRSEPKPWIEELLTLKNQIESLLPELKFNSVLLNHYRNGLDKMGWHSDDEKEMGINPTIVSVSLGATRRFDLRNKSDKNKVFKLDLTNGSLLIMRGELQHYWVHQVPQQKRITEERINLTFRKIN